jgi:hypothetical protein
MPRIRNLVLAFTAVASIFAGAATADAQVYGGGYHQPGMYGAVYHPPMGPQFGGGGYRQPMGPGYGGAGIPRGASASATGCRPVLPASRTGCKVRSARKSAKSSCGATQRPTGRCVFFRGDSQLYRSIRRQAHGAVQKNQEL